MCRRTSDSADEGAQRTTSLPSTMEQPVHHHHLMDLEHQSTYFLLAGGILLVTVLWGYVTAWLW